MSGVEAAESDSSVLQPGMKVGDHLVVRSILGQGGTAIVYEALHTRLGAPVALKVLNVPEAFWHEAALRLQREAEVCANLDDPHVPRVYDVGALPDGTPYLVMEKISGTTLEQLLQGGRLRLSVVAAIAQDLLCALEAVHRAGVVHRDIKPANLMVKLDGEGVAHVRLMDFGVSKPVSIEASNPKLTRTGMVVGTPHYMAPEQITGESIDARADLYAAGVVLFEMLTGRTPYDGATTAEVVAAVLRSAPLPIARLAPQVPPRLQRVVVRAMAGNPAERFADAHEMRRALAEAMGTPVLRTRQESGRRPIRRTRSGMRRWSLLGVGAALLLGVLGWVAAAEQESGVELRPLARAKEGVQALGAAARAAASRVAAAPVRSAPVEASPPEGQATGAGEPGADAERAEMERAEMERAEAERADLEGAAVDPTVPSYRVGLLGPQRLELSLPGEVPLQPLQPLDSEAAADAENGTAEASLLTPRSEARLGRSGRAERAASRRREESVPVQPGVLISDYVRQLEAIQGPVELPEPRITAPAVTQPAPVVEGLPPNPYLVSPYQPSE